MSDPTTDPTRTTPITSVLLIGGTGSIGRRVAVAARRRGLDVRAVVRDPARAESQLPGVDLVAGDLQDPTTLIPAVSSAQAIVFTHGGDGSPNQSQRIDYGGVAAVLCALDGRRPRLALMTSIGVSRLGAYSGSTAELMSWKRRSERLVRASGAPYTIVRPGWFDHVDNADRRLVLEQTDTGNGGIGRDQLADVLTISLLTDSAIGRTFELFAGPGQAPSDWSGLFDALAADPVPGLDGAGDPETLPSPTQEPQRVQDDLAALRS